MARRSAVRPSGPGSAAGGEVIQAVPLRRPGRVVAAVVILVLLGLFVYGAATNDAYYWSTYWQYLFDARFSAAAVALEMKSLRDNFTPSALSSSFMRPRKGTGAR